MGLDLIVEGCAKPGHEREWRELLDRAFADEELTDEEVQRFSEVSIPPFQRIGAPRVGHDVAANEWILKARRPKTPEEAAAVLKEFDGYFVVQLVKCDGVPEFSNSGMYEGVDDTSFRGAFLDQCKDVLEQDLLSDAWNHKLPDDAIDYGNALLMAAQVAESDGRAPKKRHTLMTRLGLAKAPEPLAIAEQIDIVRTAGRWFVFWVNSVILSVRGSDNHPEHFRRHEGDVVFMTRRIAILAVIVFSLAAAGPSSTTALQSATSAASAISAIKIPIETYTLPNGLTVILSVDRATPTVSLNVWYHVGSKNERPGRTGFAHLFEHVMFTGSSHVPYGLHDKLTEGVGGSNNGTTGNDQTMYFETVPSNYLESALWLESDRMGYLLETLDTGKLNAQREIVKNERRQNMDNQPYGRVEEILAHATYPAGHPYSWSVIGSMDDLSAASEEDVKDFFRLNYAPNNAILVISGDFDAASARAWTAKYFSAIPQGKPITRPKAGPVTLPAETRLVFEDRVQTPRLYIQWPTVGEKSDDRFALRVLDTVLTGPRTARLTKALVYDQQIAASVEASQDSHEDAGEFLLTVTPRPGHSLAEIEAVVDSIIDKVKREGPSSEEIQKATAGLELSFLTGLQSNLGKTFRLASGAGYHNDAGYYRVEYQKSMAVTAAEVKRVANKYLTQGRVVLSVVPPGGADQASKPSASKRVDMYDTKQPGKTK